MLNSGSAPSVAEIVRASRASQGLPPTVTDPVVLARLGRLLELRPPARKQAPS